MQKGHTPSSLFVTTKSLNDSQGVFLGMFEDETYEEMEYSTKTKDCFILLQMVLQKQKWVNIGELLEKSDYKNYAVNTVQNRLDKLLIKFMRL